MELKVGTYNLQNGGIDGDDFTRLRSQLNMLDSLNADVWALQECSRWDENGGLELAEEMLGMKGYIALSSKNPGGNLAVLVRTGDIEVTGTRHESLLEDERTPYWHGVAVVHTIVKGFGPLRFASAHLAPSSPDKRSAEGEYFQLIADKPVPLIVGLDANGYALNEPERDVTGIHPAKVRRKSDTRAALHLAEYMTDVGEFLKDTTPTVGHTRDDKLAYRADREYTTLPGRMIKSNKVVQEEKPKSDHLAVLSGYDLEAA
jgi:endonuclease/exonuclease/phosphatase family metal-dependent hydrolase